VKNKNPTPDKSSVGLEINNLQLARGMGLSLFCQSALASPLDETSEAPVLSRMFFALWVQSELSE
jgi:hypothetical protein